MALENIDWVPVALLMPFAYLAGSVNFAILLFKITGKQDPRNAYSGNPGATNVYRQAGRFWAMCVFLLDMGRAVGIAVISLRLLDSVLVPWSGFFLILGNRYPCFHGFKGGKGVANFLGFTLVVAPWAAAASCISWLIVKPLVKVSFIPSFVMVAILSVGAVARFHVELSAVFGVLLTTLLIVVGHKENIKTFYHQQTRQG